MTFFDLYSTVSLVALAQHLIESSQELTLVLGCIGRLMSLTTSLNVPVFDIGVVQGLYVVIPRNPLIGNMSSSQEKKSNEYVDDARIDVDVVTRMKNGEQG
jgi:hypothetical protein